MNEVTTIGVDIAIGVRPDHREQLFQIVLRRRLEAAVSDASHRRVLWRIEFRDAIRGEGIGQQVAQAREGETEGIGEIAVRADLRFRDDVVAELGPIHVRP